MLVASLGHLWKKLPTRIRLYITRFSQTTFTVSVAGVIANKNREVLVLDHVFRPRSGWGIPGGFVNPGEQPAAAFEREVLEETGLVLNNITLYKVRTLKRHVEIIFVANAHGMAELRSSEIRGFGWFKLEDLPEAMNKNQKLLISEVLSHEI